MLFDVAGEAHGVVSFQFFVLGITCNDPETTDDKTRKNRRAIIHYIRSLAGVAKTLRFKNNFLFSIFAA